MADAPEESAEITEKACALVINLGTLSTARAKAMHSSGLTANRIGIPAVLDPVGVGATAFRRETASALLREIRFAAIKGNASEIRFLAGISAECSSADASDADSADAVHSADAAKRLAQKTGAVVMLTGETDLVTDGIRMFRIRNGHPMMSRITGSGCMLSALTAAFLAVRPKNPLTACVTAACAMGLAGEIALPSDGNMTFRNALIDAVFRMTEQQLEEGARYEAEC